MVVVGCSFWYAACVAMAPATEQPAVRCCGCFLGGLRCRLLALGIQTAQGRNFLHALGPKVGIVYYLDP